MIKVLFFLVPLLGQVLAGQGQGQAPVSEENVPLNTTKGAKMLLAPNTASWSYFLTMIHLPTQKTQTWCSIASSVTVLNALASDRAPIDPMYDPNPYWTQENFFTNCTDAIKDKVKVTKMGASLEELDEMLHCHDINTKIVYGSDVSLDDFHSILRERLSTPDGTYVLVNYHRTEVHQEGGGHFSPVVALNPAQDMVLIADVSRYKYAPTWVKISDLFNAVNTQDNVSGKSRGLMLMS
mmetsp:Transcript_17049/g.28469  ORF Transcript_17049/g.28469 Transcript_17049/m.28469 type:complete len:238 (-) Transcript_17049:330-1043(-)|eukprot:CAMPEP_0114427324 /NCGR_PEP_ID=MMETSP0103-20121206/8283_1 /TAXON_ID=37642 ORGANISM="Paraphysomonas imperforata, Strain PA2" /NCGR_SAMPLE_ID=MMETSP0103 /ASSEMBLY_ACC=CAM_ASM_000201 /LENGTH=237 /DNA_ID=CAMNT_0001596369 /DNA_START=38 /DNA_END=751 /DNA_ORIENTATION=+